MKIGIFDSGLGGLFILKNLRNQLRHFDFVYLGDTKNLPYGDKSQGEIYRLTKCALNYLFEQDCQLVIIACNSASSVLRKLQKDWLPKTKYSNRRVLGVIRPTIEKALTHKPTKIGIIGTRRTIQSKTYSDEILGIKSNVKIISFPTPQFVPMIESGKSDISKIMGILQPLIDAEINILILACTHYGIIKKQLKLMFDEKVAIISQEDILPQKVYEYLNKHPEISNRLSKRGTVDLYITKKSPRYQTLVKKWFGCNAIAKVVVLTK
jgi:glutamate racemase